MTWQYLDDIIATNDGFLLLQSEAPPHPTFHGLKRTQTLGRGRMYGMRIWKVRGFLSWEV